MSKDIQQSKSPCTVIPNLMIDGAADALKLYAQALGAKEVYKLESDKGKIMHACLEIGNSRIFIAETCPEMKSGPSVASFYVYVDDVDAAYKKASAAGLQEKNAVEDMFWGDRVGTLKDKFGISWSLATHVRDVSDDEIKKSAAKMQNKAA